MLWNSNADRKIKIVLSDLHMCGGRILPDGNINYAEDFLYDRELVDFLHYIQEEYNGFDIEIIINGDFVDFLKTVGGLQYISDIPKEAVYSALERIINGHSEVFKALRDFMNSGQHHLTIIVGNHDQPLLCPDVQARLKEVISERVRFVPLYYQFEGVFVAHGHQYELIHRFNVHKLWVRDTNGREVLNMPWGSYFVVEFLNPLKKEKPVIDRVKPFKNFLKWGLYFETFYTLKTLVRLVWFYIRNRFFTSDPMRRRKFAAGFSDLMDAILHRTLEANAKRILKREDIHTVVFGHSHIPLFRIFHGKQYFNTGTWTENISLDMTDFGRSNPMSFLLFRYVDGRPVGSLLRWRGEYRPVEEMLP